jgi:hypothetical protein
MPTVTQEDPKEKTLNDAGARTDKKTGPLKPADQGNKSQEAEPQTGELKKDEGTKEEQDKKSEAGDNGVAEGGAGALGLRNALATSLYQ